MNHKYFPVPQNELISDGWVLAVASLEFMQIITISAKKPDSQTFDDFGVLIQTIQDLSETPKTLVMLRNNLLPESWKQLREYGYKFTEKPTEPEIICRSGAGTVFITKHPMGFFNINLVVDDQREQHMTARRSQRMTVTSDQLSLIEAAIMHTDTKFELGIAEAQVFRTHGINSLLLSGDKLRQF